MTPIGLPEDVDDSHDECHALAVFDTVDEPARDATAVLTVPERQAAWALANGKTAREAAKVAGVSERTVWRWIKKRYFREALSEAADFAVQMTDAAPMVGKARVQASTPKIADKLIETALNDNHPDQFRAISKALEVAGLTGPKGSYQQTNVQVNVDVQAQVADDMAEAKRIMAEVRDGEAAPDA